MQFDKLLVRCRLSHYTQACKSSSPDKILFQNSSLSDICQSTQDPLQSSIDFLFFLTNQSASHSVYSWILETSTCAVLSCVCPCCLLHVCLSAFRCRPQKCTLFYSLHWRVNNLKYDERQVTVLDVWCVDIKPFLCDYIICILLPDKLYVKRPKQTGFILFPGTEHVRGSMTHLIPLHAALKSWYSSSCSTCCWAHCSVRGHFHVAV